MYDKYKAKFGLRTCVVLLGDLTSVDMSKYTMVRKKTAPITLDLVHSNIISSARYKYKCETCTLTFKDYGGLEEHRKEHIAAEGGSSKEDETSSSTSEAEEDESFTESSTSDEGEQKKPKENSFQCKFCNRVFKYHYTYANHLKQHKYFVCTKCHKILDTKESLDQHLQDEHKVCPCKLCPQMFYSERNLEMHLKQKHYKNGIKCVVCSKEFASISELDVHTKTHTEVVIPIEEENLVCDLCTQKFKNESELDKHLSTHFSIVKILPKRKKKDSIEIDKTKPLTVKSIQTLSDHKCTLCSKIFLTKEHLDTHLAKHLQVHKNALAKESQPGLVGPTVATIPGSEPMIVSGSLIAANVITKSGVQTIPNSTVTTAPTMIKPGSAVPLLQNKQIIISTAASISTTSNVTTNSLTLNSNQHKLILMNDKKYLIVSESSSISPNGVIKLVVTDPSKPNAILQAIPALQPLSAGQPINNFLPPTIVVPNAQNEQIGIQKLNITGNLSQGTTNIMYTTPTGETITPVKSTKTYSGKSRKVGKVVSATVGLPAGAVVPQTRTVGASKGTVVTTMVPTTLLVAPSRGRMVSSAGTMAATKVLLAPTTPTSSVNAATTSTAAAGPVSTLVTPSTSEVTQNAELENSEDFKPKIFLKPLSQLLEKQREMPNLPPEKVLEASPIPDTSASDKQEDGKVKKIHKCNECHVVCKRLVKLMQHQSKYKCKICDFGCCKLKMLDIHYSEKHNYKNRCVSCDTQFPTLSDLQQHKKSVHLCKKCNRCYFDLNKHQNNYRCSNCDFYACGAPGLDTHYKLVHRITTRCAPCNKIFYSNETFQQHKQEIHFCDKCCTYKMDLNVHKTFCKGGPKASATVSNSPEVIELDSD